MTLYLLPALLVAAVGIAQAQTAPAASPAKKELVAKIVKLQQPSFENLARQLAEQPALQIMQQAGARLQQMPADRREAVAKDIQADLRKYADETVPLVRDRAVKLIPVVLSPMMEERLSEEELKQVLAMMEAPVFRKFQGLTLEMQRALLEKLVPESRPLVEPKLRALGESVAKRLAPPAAASAPAAGTKK